MGTVQEARRALPPTVVAPLCTRPTHHQDGILGSDPVTPLPDAPFRHQEKGQLSPLKRWLQDPAPAFSLLLLPRSRKRELVAVSNTYQGPSCLLLLIFSLADPTPSRGLASPQVCVLPCQPPLSPSRRSAWTCTGLRLSLLRDPKKFPEAGSLCGMPTALHWA